MLGIFIQLAISWGLLKWIEGENLSVLGLLPTGKRVLNLVLGLLCSAVIISLYYFSITYFTGNSWTFNASYTTNDFFTALWWTLKSVLFEELLFRGVLLYLLLKRLGEIKACLLSAVAFGIYHWFSYQVLGQPVTMIYVWVTTGIWGFMFAFAFARTRSLYLPVGLHFGWNLFDLAVFSQGTLGDQLLVHSENGTLLSDTTSITLQIFQVFALPALVIMYLKTNKPAFKVSQ